VAAVVLDSVEQVRGRAHAIRAALPAAGLFAGQEWRLATEPFALGTEVAREIETLGRVLLQFYRASNLLYRKSVAGQMPGWVAQWLDLGKPADLIAFQRAPVFKNEIPRVIRPDLLLTDDGLRVTELDSVPGGIGLMAWLNQTYARVGSRAARDEGQGATSGSQILGGADGMLRGFAGIFGDVSRVDIVVSAEAATYRPEMEWLSEQLGPRFAVRDAGFGDFQPKNAVYRFFELFDLPNVPNARRILELAAEGKLSLTPPPKPIFEEKLLFALLWNRNLQGFWRQELGEGFLTRLKQLTPYTWLVDPTPLPPHAAIPELNLTDWRQLAALSQKERDLILKVSGFSDRAWGARGVFLGSDLSQADWTRAVNDAVDHFATTPCVLQRYHKPALRQTEWFDFGADRAVRMPGRVRLCPYYFVAGVGDDARPQLGGVLATICPADKKIIHGMTDAVLAPCVE
jgi:hypothetical protein